MNEKVKDEEVFTVHRVLISEWKKVREIRMQSVLDSPQAFGDSIETVAARTQEVWEQWIENSYQYVTEVNGAFIASITLRQDQDGIWVINGVWTSPAHRNKGLSRKLFKQVFEVAKEMHISSLQLKVNPTQVGAMHVYQSLGFIKIGTSEELPLGDGSHPILDVLKKVIAPSAA